MILAAMSGVQTAIPLVLSIGASIIAVISIVAAINSMLSWFDSLLLRGLTINVLTHV